MRIALTGKFFWLTCAMLAFASFAQVSSADVDVIVDVNVDDTPEFWGPPVGTTAPAIDAADQDGVMRDLTSLSGERGVLLVLSRSADW